MTAATTDEYGPFDAPNPALARRVTEVAEKVGAIAPDCVGLSVTLRELEVTFTLVASERDVALLDAIQYLDGGPCVDAILHDTVVTTFDEPRDEGQDDRPDEGLHEGRWPLFTAARTAHGIASTFSLPIVWNEVVIGGFNLYGSSSSCFEGHHDDLVRTLGAWAAGAATRADLAFGTRDIARRAPAVLQQGVDLDVVCGLLASTRGTDAARWEDRIRTAAVRAGIPLAPLVVSLRETLGQV